VSAPALAETNVAIYGIIDAGLLYQSKTDPNGKSKTSMETSGLRQSVLGFKGDRDLGRGLEGFFNLEVHYDTNNGKLHGTGDAQGTGTPSSGARPTWACAATGAA
jgi:predicted porin